MMSGAIGHKCESGYLSEFYLKGHVGLQIETFLLYLLNEHSKYKMKEMGLKAKDLEPIIGSKGHVSAILSGKREITLKMAQKLKN